jgi:hypothetical protein
MFCAPGHVFVGAEGRQVLFSCFALPDSFSVFPRESDLDFMFCVPVLVFGGTEGVGSRFHSLRSWTRFRPYRGRRVPFSCCAHPNSFLAVPKALRRASGPVFMFCVPELIFGGTVGVRSRFHDLRSWKRFRRRQVPFSCFALQNLYSAVRRASGLVFKLCAPVLVFGGSEGVVSRFHILRSRTSFRW